MSELVKKFPKDELLAIGVIILVAWRIAGLVRWTLAWAYVIFAWALPVVLALAIACLAVTRVAEAWQAEAKKRKA